MEQYQAIRNNYLLQKGLNMQAVFDLSDLPVDIVTTLKSHCSELEKFSQLILISHGGKTLWHELKKSAIHSADPVDDFSVASVKHYFSEYHPDCSYKVLYPGACNVDLQKLGRLAGWHHPTPFMLGINSEWGTWFAYRVLVLADTQFQASKPLQTESPCLTCQDKPCITNCAGNAISTDSFSLNSCVSYRKQVDSKCKDICISRVSCPVAVKHRYTMEQINYHYSVSMKTIEQFY